jgi:hypothetical protein
MAAESLVLENIGPIKKAEVSFGDLTVLVGPQATGKSVFLEFLKLLLDSGPIFRSLRKYGLDWNKDRDEFLDLYLGEGMRGIWGKGSRVRWQGRLIDFDEFVRPRKGKAMERAFFIPAQRVLALSRDGWLRPFEDYRAGDPYVVRDFSEKLRALMVSGLGRGDAIFPQSGRLKSEIRDLLDKSVFSGFRLQVEKSGPQKRLVLREEGRNSKLPFMVWSAGQREFVPLLLGLYWLMPTTRVARRGSVEWVIVEEMELGLHPKGTAAMLAVVLELLFRGYRVCLSTHSPHVLDLVWALRVFRENRARPKSVIKLFGAQPSQSMLHIGKKTLKKSAYVYYFDRESGATRDISKLDPGSDAPGEAGWGGLTEFSSHVADEVASVVAARGGNGL